MSVQYHPEHRAIAAREARIRDTYIATHARLRRHLVPFRTEGYNTKPELLARARFGYGVSLNRSWIQGIIGAIQSAPHQWNWGQFAPGEDGGPDAPAGTMAEEISYDVTDDGRSLREFEVEVAEWMLGGLGGVIIVDSNARSTDANGRALSAAEQRAARMRPFAQFVPASGIVDFGRSRHGYSYVTLREEVDERMPFTDEVQPASVVYFVTYALVNGQTIVRRVNEKGELATEDRVMGEFVDALGRPCLPLVEVRHGRDHEFPHLSAGLLTGLDDVVIQLYNTTNEMIESSRDGMGLYVVSGPDSEQVLEQIVSGSAAVAVGENGNLNYVGSDVARTEAKMAEIELALKAWRLGAENKVREAESSAAANSGVSLSVDFALNERPLLVSVAQSLEKAITDMLYLMSQMAGHRIEEAREVGLEIDKRFQLEDEITIISRSVQAFIDTGLPLPAEAKARLAMRWLEASDMIDLGADAGNGQTVGELIEAQLAEETEARTRDRVAANFARLRALAAPAVVEADADVEGAPPADA